MDIKEYMKCLRQKQLGRDPKFKETWEEVDIPTHPLKDAMWVKVIAKIRDNSTGEVRDFKTNEILDNLLEYPSVFNWEENNFSCDCNRGNFFNQSSNEDSDYEDTPCGDGKYSVQLVNPVTGNIYYKEF